MYPWAACAKAGILVSLEDWLSAKGCEKSAEEVKKYLPGVFSRIIGDVSTIEKTALDRSSDPSISISTEKQSIEALKCANDYSVNLQHFEGAVRQAVVSCAMPPAKVGGFDKSAENADKYSELAKAYAVHQLQWVKVAAASSGHIDHYCKVVVAYNLLA